jgi:hypothetical protein
VFHLVVTMKQRTKNCIKRMHDAEVMSLCTIDFKSCQTDFNCISCYESIENSA